MQSASFVLRSGLRVESLRRLVYPNSSNFLYGVLDCLMETRRVAFSLVLLEEGEVVGSSVIDTKFFLLGDLSMYSSESNWCVALHANFEGIGSDVVISYLPVYFAMKERTRLEGILYERHVREVTINSVRYIWS